MHQPYICGQTRDAMKMLALEFTSVDVDFGAIYVRAVCLFFVFVFKRSSSGFSTGEHSAATVPNIPKINYTTFQKIYTIAPIGPLIHISVRYSH